MANESFGLLKGALQYVGLERNQLFLAKTLVFPITSTQCHEHLEIREIALERDGLKSLMTIFVKFEAKAFPLNLFQLEWLENIMSVVT